MYPSSMPKKVRAMRPPERSVRTSQRPLRDVSDRQSGIPTGQPYSVARMSSPICFRSSSSSAWSHRPHGLGTSARPVERRRNLFHRPASPRAPSASPARIARRPIVPCTVQPSICACDRIDHPDLVREHLVPCDTGLFEPSAEWDGDRFVRGNDRTARLSGRAITPALRRTAWRPRRRERHRRLKRSWSIRSTHRAAALPGSARRKAARAATGQPWRCHRGRGRGTKK